MLRMLLVVAALGCTALFAAENAKKEAARVGDEIPDLSAKDETGKEVRLSDFKGKSGVVLFFYPKADTPGCTKESCGFRDELDKLVAKGYQPLGASRDTPEAQKAFKEKFKLTYPLLSDPDNKLSAAFGFTPGQRATAVIGKDGKIEKLVTAVAAATHAQDLLKDLGAK